MSKNSIWPHASLVSLYSYAILLSIHTLFPLPFLPQPGVLSLCGVALGILLVGAVLLKTLPQSLPPPGAGFYLWVLNAILLIACLLLHPLIWTR